MPKHIIQFLLVFELVTGTSWAAGNPFVGKWKLNPSRSQLTDEMKVEALGSNKYVFDFGGSKPVTVVANGTDQPTGSGLTMSVVSEGPKTWKFVGKKDGHIRSTATWTLSGDGQTLSDDRTVYRPDGSPQNVHYLYKRTAGASGFAGTWVSTSEKVNFVFEVEIRPYKNNGLSFVNAAQESTQSLEFDGKDYPNQSRNAAAESFSSGHQTGESTLEITDKANGKVTDTRQLKLSPDLKTLIMIVHIVGRNIPNILIFDRQ